MYTCVVGNEEADIGIVQDSSDTDQAGTAARHNGNIFPGVLAGLALTMHLVVQTSDRLSQGLDASGGAVLTAADADVDGRGPAEAPGNVVFDLRNQSELGVS